MFGNSSSNKIKRWECNSHQKLIIMTDIALSNKKWKWNEIILKN